MDTKRERESRLTATAKNNRARSTAAQQIKAVLDKPLPVSEFEIRAEQVTVSELMSKLSETGNPNDAEIMRRLTVRAALLSELDRVSSNDRAARRTLTESERFQLDSLGRAASRYREQVACLPGGVKRDNAQQKLAMVQREIERLILSSQPNR